MLDLSLPICLSLSLLQLLFLLPLGTPCPIAPIAWSVRPASNMDSASADASGHETKSSSGSRAEAASKSRARIARARIAPAGERWANVLGLPTPACTDDVKRVYKQLALLHHPDKPHGDADTFKLIKEAYEVGLRRCLTGWPAAAAKPEESADAEGMESAAASYVHGKAEGKDATKAKVTLRPTSKAAAKEKAKVTLRATGKAAAKAKSEVAGTTSNASTSTSQKRGTTTRGDAHPSAQADAHQKRHSHNLESETDTLRLIQEAFKAGMRRYQA